MQKDIENGKGGEKPNIGKGRGVASQADKKEIKAETKKIPVKSCEFISSQTRNTRNEILSLSLFRIQNSNLVILRNPLLSLAYRS